MSRGPAALVGLMLALVGLTAACSTSTTKAPYIDPAAAGVIGLCDRSGHSIRSGTTGAEPFVWRAVSSVAATAPYSGPGRTATLMAYQPRQGVPPGQWSGALLTTSSEYSNPAHPMSQLTDGDLPLSDFLSTFPARWHGFIQLRLYLGAPGVPNRTATYAAADLRISGNKWTVVRGGNGDCTAGTATSMETVLLGTPTTTPRSS